VHFKIHGQGKKNLNGDGFAIWYTKDRMQPGKAAGVEAVWRGDGAGQLQVSRRPSPWSIGALRETTAGICSVL